ncbi:MAG: ketopantoate reductase [Cognaticolwellia sp.]|jgi:ketopantoate reductase
MTPTIIGAGRVGLALAKIASTRPHARGQSWSKAQPGPLIVCTRNDDLAGVIQATPAARRTDLVFIQNGMIEPLLKDHGLLQNTQALVYFAVSAKGQDPVDGGGTVVSGPWAQEFQSLLGQASLGCSVVAPHSFQLQMVEKLLWNCVFGLLCQRHSASVGVLVREQGAEIQALSDELQGVAERALDLALQPGVPERLCDYSMKIADYRGAVKELPWRNGWFLAQEQSPLHSQWLQALAI